MLAKRDILFLKEDYLNFTLESKLKYESKKNGKNIGTPPDT